jgi:hypothetical protein
MIWVLCHTKAPQPNVQKPKPTHNWIELIELNKNKLK